MEMFGAGTDLEGRLRRLVPWVALLTCLLWAPLVLPDRHSWDDADPEVLNNAYRLSRGEPLYHGVTTPPWVVSPYTPLYHALLAAALRITDLGYRPARLLSLLASLALAAALAVLARRWRGRARDGLWASCLLLILPAVLSNFARPHPQMLAVALSVWTFALFESRHRILAAGLSPFLAVLAVYTKQTQFALPLALGLWLLAKDRPRLIAYAGTVALLGLAPVPWLQAWTGGAFLDSVVGMNFLPYHAGQIAPVLIHHAGAFFPFLWLALSRLAARLRAGTLEPIDCYLLVVVLVTVPSLGRAGASGQWVVELLVVGALFLLRTGGLIFPPAHRRLAVAQLALVLAYGPAFVLLEEGPWDRASIRAAPAIRAILESAPGPVISQQGSFSLFTRGEIHIQLFHFAALAQMGRWDQGPLLREVEERRVGWVVTESPLEEPLTDDDARERFTPELWAALGRNYVRQAHLGPYFVYAPRGRPTPPPQTAGGEPARPGRREMSIGRESGLRSPGRAEGGRRGRPESASFPAEAAQGLARALPIRIERERTLIFPGRGPALAPPFEDPTQPFAGRGGGGKVAAGRDGV
ncbi:MAG TPA: glycosyltransferase family 39 protein [Vicinamibacteria bacterium]|nr:glycosyltransferase family 39 protein [Vicinamibacteria bacterium]